MSIYSPNLYGFYIYAYLRYTDSATGLAGTPYYIGKGSKKRAWQRHGNVATPKLSQHIVILAHNLTEIGAFALERRYIKWYGRKNNKTGILHNRTDGGEGTCGNSRPSPHRGKSRSKAFAHKVSNARSNLYQDIKERNKTSIGVKKYYSDAKAQSISITKSRYKWLLLNTLTQECAETDNLRNWCQSHGFNSSWFYKSKTHWIILTKTRIKDNQVVIDNSGGPRR
jgi:hypothetical protein